LVLGLLLGAGHLWLVRHARQLVEDAVFDASKGKVTLRIQNMNYHYRKKTFQLKNVVVFNNDTIGKNDRYNFAVPLLKLELISLGDLIFKKKLGIASLYISTPQITLERKEKETEKAAALSTEMGQVYNEILSALQKLQITQLTIHQGSFSLINRVKDSAVVTKVSNIFLAVDSLQISKQDITSHHNSKSDPFLAKNIRFHSYNQHIDLPGGTHRLGFRQLAINMKDRALLLDSCYITSLYKNKNNIKAAFDTLLLKNIDFATLYLEEIIKADSVYCVQPNLALSLTGAEKSNQKTLKEVLEDIGTDMEFQHLALKNAALTLSTTAENKATTFSGKNRLVEINGLVLRPSSESPLEVDDFYLEGENYSFFTPDSLYAIQLRSLGLKKDSLLIKDVSIKTYKNRPEATRRNYTIPALTLFGVNWQQLLFERQLEAREMLMSRPSLVFIKKGRKDRKLSLYDAFDAVNDLVNVERIGVVEGNFNFKFSNQDELSIEGVNGRVSGRQLLQASNTKEVEEAVQFLRFEKGFMKAGQWRIDLQEAVFNGETGDFSGEEVLVSNATLNFKAALQQLSLFDFRLNDDFSLLTLQKIKWQQANVLWNEINLKKKNISTQQRPFNLILGEISGGPTMVQWNGSLQESAWFNLLQMEANNLDIHETSSAFDLLSKSTLKGSEMHLKLDSFTLHSDTFSLQKNRFLEWKNLSAAWFAKPNPEQLHHIFIPSLQVFQVSPSKMDILHAEKDSPYSTSDSSSAGFMVDSVYLQFPVWNTVEEKSLSKLYPWHQVKTPSAESVLLDKINRGNRPLVVNKPSSSLLPHLQIKALWADALGWKLPSAWAEHPTWGKLEQKNQNSAQLLASNLILQHQLLQIQKIQWKDHILWQTETIGASEDISAQLDPNESGALEFQPSLTLGNINLPLKNLRNQWSAEWEELLLPQTRIPGLTQILLNNIQLNSRYPLTAQTDWKNWKMHLHQLLQLPETNITIAEISGSDYKTKWEAKKYRMNGSPQGGHLFLDTFSWSPLLAKDSFVAAQVFENDYLTWNANNIRFSGMRWNSTPAADALNTALDPLGGYWSVDSGYLEKFNLYAFRDKKPPFQHGVVKPMPITMLRTLPLSLRIQQLNLEQSTIAYEEWNDKTEKQGKVELMVTNSRVKNIKTGTIPPYWIGDSLGSDKENPQENTDSLQFLGNGTFMKDIPFQIEINFAYTDTTDGFQVYLLAGPASLTTLNSMLPPLASLYIKKGRMSQLKMMVSGDREKASGTMQVRYQGLQIRLLRKGDPEKKGFFAGIAGFLANQFILKHQNQYRVSPFTYYRNEEKSFFNYLVKNITKGIGANTGLSKSKKKVSRKTGN
jgi:hypothetical protein